MKIGHGFDAHKFESQCKLVLGGVSIEHHQGLEAYSDGDVVIHALCDALLGAMGLGDIGIHFPDGDERYKNVDSRILLRRVNTLLEAEQLSLGNADITIIDLKKGKTEPLDPTTLPYLTTENLVSAFFVK